MTLTLLGSGTSQGIPVVGCGCAVCRSADSKNNRMRASLLVKGGSCAAVIDTGPEFRLQALRADITRLDAVFLTHAHADHLHGLDDVRPLTSEKRLPVYCNHSTSRELRERFSYIFEDTQQGGGKPRIIPIETNGPVDTGCLRFTPIPVKHGALDIFGWRVEETEPPGQSPETALPNRPAAVYLTDVSAIPESSFSLIGRPEILIIGGLRMRPHETHFNFEQALSAAVQTGAKQVYLTHICHDYSHQQIAEYCDTFMRDRGLSGISMEPAWDELKLTLSW